MVDNDVLLAVPELHRDGAHQAKRKKLFGIPMPRSRKSSFESPPLASLTLTVSKTAPKTVPPALTDPQRTPTAKRPGYDQDKTPKPLWTTRVPSRPTTPTPAPKSKANDPLSNSLSSVSSASLKDRPPPLRNSAALRVSHPRPKASPTSPTAPTSSDSTSSATAPQPQHTRRRSSSVASPPTNLIASQSSQFPPPPRPRKSSLTTPDGELLPRYRPMAIVDEESLRSSGDLAALLRSDKDNADALKDLEALRLLRNSSAKGKERQKDANVLPLYGVPVSAKLTSARPNPATTTTQHVSPKPQQMSLSASQSSSNHSHSKNSHATPQPHSGMNGHIPKVNPLRDRKHGSFDFERPGFSLGWDSAIHRTGSGTSHGSKSSIGTTGTTGTRSIMTHDTHGTHGTHGTRRSNKPVKNQPELGRDVGSTPTPLPPRLTRHNDTSHSRSSSHPNPSLQPTATIAGQPTSRFAGLGLSSSLGRTTASKDSKRRSALADIGLGLARLVRSGSSKKSKGGTGGFSHGLLPFEPPVSYQSSPVVGEFGERIETRVEVPKVPAPVEKEKDARRSRRRATYLTSSTLTAVSRSNPEISQPQPLSHSPREALSSSLNSSSSVPVGFLSRTKGRSLDLGLGLAWAPRKVREDALMPSGVLGIKTGPDGRVGSFGSFRPSGEENGDGPRERKRHPYATATPVYGSEETPNQHAEPSMVGRVVADDFRSVLDATSYATFKKYVHRFDAHEIPFDGPKGIIARTEHLLDSKASPRLSPQVKQRMLDNLVKIILQNA